MSWRTSQVTRKTQIVLTVAGALVGLAVVTALWLTRGGPPPDDPAPSVQATPAPATAHPAPKEEPPDPHVLAEIREAYQQSLAENGPPEMVELMQGPGAGKPKELPPLPDAAVTPAQYNPGPSPDLPPLPPLPPSPTARPEAPPPLPDVPPAAGKMPKESPPKEPPTPLPELPPAPKSGGSAAPMPPLP